MSFLPQVATQHDGAPSALAVEHAPDSVRQLEGLARLPAVDAGRILATFAILWVHNLEGQGASDSLGALCRFGTSFYILVAALFVVRTALKDPSRTFGQDVSIRAKRLLRPYLVWCAVYGAYYGYFAYQKGATWSALSFWWGPVAGTAIHLWFLPFVFFWGVLASRAVPALLKLPRPVLWIGGVATAVFLYDFCYSWLHFAVSRPWLWDYKLHRLDRWIVEVPLFVSATLLFVGYFRLPSAARYALKRASLPLFALCLVGFVAVQAAYATNLQGIMEATHTEGRFMAHMAGFLLLGAFVCKNGSNLVKQLAPLGRYTYLVFLMHMLLIGVFRMFAYQLPGYGTVLFSFVSSLFLFCVGLAVAWAIQRFRVLSILRA